MFEFVLFKDNLKWNFFEEQKKEHVVQKEK